LRPTVAAEPQAGCGSSVVKVIKLSSLALTLVIRHLFFKSIFSLAGQYFYGFGPVQNRYAFQLTVYREY
jgi:hypothetical protein